MEQPFREYLWGLLRNVTFKPIKIDEVHEGAGSTDRDSPTKWRRLNTTLEFYTNKSRLVSKNYSDEVATMIATKKLNYPTFLPVDTPLLCSFVPGIRTLLERHYSIIHSIGHKATTEHIKRCTKGAGPSFRPCTRSNQATLRQYPNLDYTGSSLISIIVSTTSTWNNPRWTSTSSIAAIKTDFTAY